MKYNKKKWCHVAELLDFFQTFMGFRKYEEIRQDILEQSRKEDIAMDSVFVSIFDEAWGEAWDKGIEKGISALVKTRQEFHCTKEELSAKLIESFDLTPEKAEGYINQYWA